MNDNMKIEKFLSAIRAEQEKLVKDTERETKLLVAEELEKAENEVLKESYTYIQRSSAEIKAELGKKVSENAGKNTVDFLNHREELFEKIVNATAERLKEYTKTDEYFNFLKQSAKAVTARFNGKKFNFYIAVGDALAEKAVKQIAGECNIILDSSIKIGGLIATDDDGILIIDDTLDSRLEDKKEMLRKL